MTSPGTVLHIAAPDADEAVERLTHADELDRVGDQLVCG